MPAQQPAYSEVSDAYLMEYTRVQIDAWVPNASTASAPSAAPTTPDEVRSARDAAEIDYQREL